ncbi:threonine/serine ThrE exporter family protein [Sediminivirga luteola]|uniref:Threonine/serine exporter family protein n=1 Tax=Sediminivirga luteola TaxID=1774748 RepID=A0A8J2TV89_9MICO|nr:threonine/serine exporter family protein [Sediminivirga luteola]MCI2265976.1 threonine/serine exporter family protein [Sediminivirga luteola]GGA03417.1 hypothetical protein GCM10011333_02670 [Sediminivirga luteola]
MSQDEPASARPYQGGAVPGEPVAPGRPDVVADGAADTVPVPAVPAKASNRKPPSGRRRGAQGAPRPGAQPGRAQNVALVAAAAQTRRAERIARRAVTRLVVNNEPATDPLPVVETLRGTPYSRPVEAQEPDGERARQILHFAVELGKMMLRAGAGTADVESTVAAACAACGLKRAQVDLTYQSLIVHHTTADGHPITVMGINRGESLNFARLRAVHALVSDLVDGHLEFEDAQARLDAIKAQRKPFSNGIVSLAWGVLAAGLIILIGGSWVSVTLGALTTIFADRMGRILAKTGMPFFFIAFLATCASMLVAMTAFQLELISRPQYMVAAGIVVMLPTMTLLSAVQDALTNFPLTAAGRMVQVMMIFGALISGVAVGLMIGAAFGMREIEVIVGGRETGVLTVLVGVLCSGVVAAAGGVAQQVSKRLLLPAALVGILGYLALTAMSELRVGNILTTLVASTVVGLVARPLALRMGAPPIVLIIPGIFPLLQGLAIFAGAYELVTGEASLATAGANLVAAVLANAAIGVGAVFGNFLAQPLRKRRKSPGDRARTLSS